MDRELLLGAPSVEGTVWWVCEHAYAIWKSVVAFRFTSAISVRNGRQPRLRLSVVQPN